MATKKPESPNLPGTSGADNKGRKAWKKKTPAEVVLDQINKLRDEVSKDEETLKDKRRQLQKMEEARKIFESV